MNPTDKEFSRNLGFISKYEQKKINESVISIAGAGGDGGLLALQLARIGFGEIRLADPEKFDKENINRQACSTHKTIGMNKAEAVASYIREINPKIKLKVYKDGVTKKNIHEFIRGADVVIDETEFTMPHIGVMIARASRQKSIPVVLALNVGFGASITTFSPRGRTFEQMLGVEKDISLKTLEKRDIPISRWLPYLPSYIDVDVLTAVANGKMSAPSVAPGVALAAGSAAIQTILLVTQTPKRPRPIIYPKVLVIDGYSCKAKKIRYPVASHYFNLSKLFINNKLRKVVKLNY